jgi:hypothetical protein
MAHANCPDDGGMNFDSGLACTMCGVPMTSPKSIIREGSKTRWMQVVFAMFVISLFCPAFAFCSETGTTPAAGNAVFERTGWNARVNQRFMHAPVFHFTSVDGAVRYRCTLTWQHGQETGKCEVGSESPDVALADVWDTLPAPQHFDALVEALDADHKSLAGVRFSFDRIAPFAGPYRPATSGYIESGARAALWVLDKVRDDKGEQFPVLFRAAYIRILITYAESHPKTENAQRALEAACKHGKALIEGSMPADWVYANMPMSHNKEVLQVARGGMAGMAYLDLFRATGDTAFLEAAMRIADTFKKTQLEDGRWYFRVEPKTGKMLEDYTSDQAEAILFLDELIRDHARTDLVETRDKAVNWMLENPCKTFQWQQQWDDVQELPPYSNLEWFDTGLFIEYLLRHATPQNGYEKIAGDLYNYIDDQFAEWEPTETFITPGLREQYCCYHVIDWHTAHYIRVCMDFHARTGDDIYLKKAKAMADTLTAIQHPDGFFPTWMRHNPSQENPSELRDVFYGDTWANCTSYTGEMLMKLGVYLKERVPSDAQ